MKIIIQRLIKAFDLTSDLVGSLDEKSLKLKIPDVPSNTIGEQIWCMIGARESYTKAIENEGEWQGFSCSIQDSHDKSELLRKLKKTSLKLQKISIEDENYKIVEKLITLLEHEVQHHGQLIRFVYANKLKFPESWKDRYTV